MPGNSVSQHLHKPLAGDVPLAQIIDPLVREGTLYETLPENKVHCYACAHHCTIRPGGRGICQVRYNLDGKLYVPWGYVAALQCDPTEKKPFFHVHPGSDTLTFGMLGCDMRCSYCQNWDISQALRDADAARPPTEVSPPQMLDFAKRNGARCVASSYNEPLITSEWSMAIFQSTKAFGLTNLYVSNGNASREVLEYIRPYTDGYKIDLKSMRDKNYRRLGAVLENILATIRMVHEMGFWVEIVTLVIPGFNDSDGELRDTAQFIQSVSPDIPWHVTAFHPDYQMDNLDKTTVESLIRGAEIGYEAGLRYVYAGNLPGQTGILRHPLPHCQTTLIKRIGYVILDYQLTGNGTCPNCGTPIAGIWPTARDEVHLGTMLDLYFRRPRRA